MKPDDAIHIEQLALEAHVGVPEEERARAQRLVVSITLWPQVAFAELGDDVGRTVDYAVVAEEARKFASARRDKLIETMADAIAAHLLARFALRAVRIELRKYILPATDYVAVIVTRQRAAE